MPRIKQEINLECGRRLTHVMREKGVTGKELHEMTGLSTVSISLYRNGKARLTELAAALIGSALKVRPEYLLGQTDKMTLRASVIGRLDNIQSKRDFIVNLLKAEGYRIYYYKNTVCIDYYDKHIKVSKTVYLRFLDDLILFSLSNAEVLLQKIERPPVT